jgi:outer membrane protein, heavy metal efflux system
MAIEPQAKFFNLKMKFGNPLALLVFPSVFSLCLLLSQSPQVFAESSPQVYTLETIIELALRKNPLIQSVEGVIDQERGRQTAAGAYPNPNVGGAMGYGELRDAGRAGIGQSAQGQSRTEYNVTVGQPVEWPSMRAARQRVAELGVVTAQTGLLETRLNLTAQVKVAFYSLLLSQQESALARQNLDIVEQVARIVNMRVKSGEAPEFESIKAEVEILKARQQLTLADNVVRVNRVVLDTLTGGELGYTYVVHGNFLEMPKALSIDGLMTRMATEHPTIQRLLQSVERADWRIEFERQSRVPNVTVNGSYWRELGREAVQGGLSAPMPVWYRRQGEIASSLGVKRRNEAEVLRARNELMRAIYQNFQDANTTTELIEVFDKGLLKQAQEALRLAQFSFQQGASSLLEVLDAQRVLYQIQRDYVQARHALSVSISSLEQAVGGSI